MKCYFCGKKGERSFSNKTVCHKCYNPIQRIIDNSDKIYKMKGVSRKVKEMSNRILIRFHYLTKPVITKYKRNGISIEWFSSNNAINSIVVFITPEGIDLSANISNVDNGNDVVSVGDKIQKISRIINLDGEDS